MMRNGEPLYIFGYDKGDELLMDKMTYAEYLQREDLMARVRDPQNVLRIFAGQSVYLYRVDFLRGLRERDPKTFEAVMTLAGAARRNPIKFFSPHGRQAEEFLNDYTTDIRIIRAPNRVGKTTLAIVDMILDAVPCEQKWPIFSEHGVAFREWNGPIKIGVGTYKWSMHKTVIWPELKKWIPDEQLGAYSDKTEQRKPVKDIAWDRNPHIRLKCGSWIFFYVYEQDQDVFESQALHRWLWDEQPPETRFDGADERLRTLGGRHVFSLTPHAVEGRPDTGAKSFINDLDSGRKTKGHTVKTYTWGVPDVVDWVYPVEEQEKARIKWAVEPFETGDVKAQREGRARYFGFWHETSGLVIDEWDRKLHVIDDFEIPKDCTRYRGLDHGTNNPTACLCAAVDKDMNVFFYQEYYNRGRTIAENAPAIIEMCGNRRKKLDIFHDPATGIDYPRYEEDFVEQEFLKTVLDSRSFSQKEMGRQIGWLYNACGLHVQQASGAKTELSVPALKELFRIDPTRRHFATGEMGAPRIYVFASLKNFISEIEGWVWDTYASKADNFNLKETPKKKNDHLMSCALYLAQIPMRYFGNLYCKTGRGAARTLQPFASRKITSTICGY